MNSIWSWSSEMPDLSKPHIACVGGYWLGGSHNYSVDHAAGDEPQPSNAPDELMLEVLTRREREVMGLVVDGQTNRQISDVLNISERTVDRHVASILDKMSAATRTEAAVRWVRGIRFLRDV
jgi:DNA-binding NarL/FixJ family response regulator